MKEQVKEFIRSNEALLFQTLRELCAIPAPSHQEQKRAAYCKAWLEERGAQGVYIDEALNVVFPLCCEGSDEITVFVKSFDAEKKRISLGYKTEESNPWTIFKNTYIVGDVVSVKIVNMMPFGAFAEIVDGVDGLIHISQIAQRRIEKPADVLEIGQVVDAKIIDIDDEKQKVSLSIRVLLDEAQAADEAMPEEYAEEAPAEETAE